MRHIILCLLLMSLFSFSQFENKKKYLIEQCSTPPKIDGKLNEELWKRINIVKDFTQIEPKTENLKNLIKEQKWKFVMTIEIFISRNDVW